MYLYEWKCMFDYPEMKRVEFSVLSSEFVRKQFYATSPPVYYILEIWRILGSAPITVNPSHPTIPHNGLRGSVAERKKNHPNARSDSRPGACDGSKFLVMNKRCLMWCNQKPRSGMCTHWCGLFIVFFLSSV